MREVDSRIYKPVHFPVLKTEVRRLPGEPQKSENITKDNNYSQTQDNRYTEKNIFDAIEQNTVLLKDSSDKNRNYLIDKVKSLLKESTWDFLGEFDNSSRENVKDVLEGKKANTQSNDYSDKQEENTDDFSSDLSLEGLRQKITDNFNMTSLQKLISTQKNIISSLAKASREVVDFMQNVYKNVSSLSSDEKLRNMTSLKGLMLDTLA